ncbi:MAG: hypothetical protein NC191_07000 [Muribaculaceae bacterium]|nr:hypothetical protein [Muribaculaceae bacterium]
MELTDDKYISKCWDEFTTLTEEEERILRKITGQPPKLKKCTSNRAIYEHSTGKIYTSLKECAKDLGIKDTTICQNIKRGSITRKGYYFSYAEEKEN